MSNTIWSSDDSKSGLLVLKSENPRSTPRSMKYSIFAAVVTIASIFTVTAVVLGNKHTSVTVPTPQSLKATDLTNQDFVNLKNALKQYVMQDPDRKVRKLVRLSFHDLATINSPGAVGSTGCIQNQAIQSLPGNEGLSDEISQLSAFVTSRFPTTPYSFGDVISLAGKVAVETAFPCINIPWKFGRSTCASISNPGAIPMGQISTVAEVTPFLNRYGLSQQELAVLLAGAHGIKGANAVVQDSGFGFRNTVFADVNSGLQWIIVTVGPWGSVTAPNGFLQFIDRFFLRLPIDFLFFPSVADDSGGKGDPEAAPVESFMRSFLNQPRSAFDAEFEKVYAKMLEIGTSNDNLKTFEDGDAKSSECTFDFPPAVPLPPVQEVKTTIPPSTKTDAPEVVTSVALEAPAVTATGPPPTNGGTGSSSGPDPSITNSPVNPAPDGKQRNADQPPTQNPARPQTSTSPLPTPPLNSAMERSNFILSIFPIVFVILL